MVEQTTQSRSFCLKLLRVSLLLSLILIIGVSVQIRSTNATFSPVIHFADAYTSASPGTATVDNASMTGSLNAPPLSGAPGIVEAMIYFDTGLYNYTQLVQTTGNASVTLSLTSVKVQVQSGGAAFIKVFLIVVEYDSHLDYTSVSGYSPFFSQDTSTGAHDQTLKPVTDVTWRPNHLYRSILLVYALSASLPTPSSEASVNKVQLSSLTWNTHVDPPGSFSQCHCAQIFPNPVIVHARQNVKITGTFFPSNTQIKIYVNSTLEKTLTSNSTGGFQTSITAPSKQGTYQLTANATPTPPSVSTPLQVIAPIPPYTVVPAILVVATLLRSLYSRRRR